MKNFLHILQNIDKYFKPEHEEIMEYPKEAYKLTKEDTFIDIGSGFGKPVFHAAMQVGCYSKGIEIVPARVTYCIDFLYEYENNRKFQIAAEIEKQQKAGKVELDAKLTPPKVQAKKAIKICNPLAFDYTESDFIKEDVKDEDFPQSKPCPPPSTQNTDSPTIDRKGSDADSKEVSAHFKIISPKLQKKF